jgi:hypothetical protein
MRTLQGGYKGQATSYDSVPMNCLKAGSARYFCRSQHKSSTKWAVPNSSQPNCQSTKKPQHENWHSNAICSDEHAMLYCTCWIGSDFTAIRPTQKKWAVPNSSQPNCQSTEKMIMRTVTTMQSVVTNMQCYTLHAELAVILLQ